jgi:tRNA threonylcarbamoyladenosine biosynthesis protein TsaB
MSAKALAYAAGCALVGIETFAALALQAPVEAPWVDVLSDAQQDRVYRQRFERRPDGSVGALAPLDVVPATDWLAGRGDEAWVSGPGLRSAALRAAALARVVPKELWEARPDSLLKLALPRLAAGEVDDVWSLEPLCLRPSSAEEKWRALGK